MNVFVKFLWVFFQLIGFYNQENNKVLFLSILVSVGKGNGEIKLYDLETQKLASILKRSQNPNLCDGHASKVFSIVNHPLNPQEFISGGWDGEIHIWDARRPHSVRRIEVRINPWKEKIQCLF